MQISNQWKHELFFVLEQTICSLMSQDFAEDSVLCIIHHYVIVSGIKILLCISQLHVPCWITTLEQKYSKKQLTPIMIKQIHYVFRIAFRISTPCLGPILSCSHQNLINSPTIFNFSLLSQIILEIIAAKKFFIPNSLLNNN